MSGDKKAQSRRMADVVIAGIEKRLIDFHTCIPGEVVSYDSLLQEVKVKIAMKRQVGDTEYDYPIMEGIPVSFQRSSKGGLTFQLEKGDSGLLLFSERNLDQWKTIGSGYVPLDSRKFDISDAIFLPGVFPKKGAMVPPQKKGFELRGEKVLLGNPSQFMTPVTTVPAVPPAGPTSPTVSPLPPDLGELDVVRVLGLLIELVANAGYGVGPPGPTGGGGPIDALTLSALMGLKADLDKIKVPSI